MNEILKQACELYEADLIKRADGGGWTGWDTAKTVMNPMSYVTGGGKAQKDTTNLKTDAQAKANTQAVPIEQHHGAKADPTGGGVGQNDL